METMNELKRKAEDVLKTRGFENAPHSPVFTLAVKDLSSFKDKAAVLTDQLILLGFENKKESPGTMVAYCEMGFNGRKKRVEVEFMSAVVFVAGYE